MSWSWRLRLVTPTSTLIVLDITKMSSNNCLQLHCYLNAFKSFVFFFFCVLSEPFSNWNMPVPAWLKLCRPTIEPVIFLYAYGLFMHMPVIQQYVYKRVSVAKNFPYSSSTKERCQNQTLNTTLKELEKEVMWYKIIKTNFYFKNTSFDSAQVICVHLI